MGYNFIFHYLKQQMRIPQLWLLMPILSQCLLQSCPVDYFFDAQHCESCTPNCACSSKDTCSSCVAGYTMFKGSCIECPQAAGIYGQCSGCCSREEGTILSCTDCTLVADTYSFLFSGRCILSDGCFEADSNGFCTECRSGYYELNNKCGLCDPSCSSCYDGTSCAACAEGYYWKVANGGLCTSCPDGCSGCDSTGICSSCKNNYYLYGSHCLQCPSNCLVCVDGSTCSSCSVGILVSNLCIECTDSTYGGSTGCLSCQENSNFIECIECADTYFLDAGVCRKCSDQITGANRCNDGNTPTQCLYDYNTTLSARYYLVGITCVANAKSCRQIAGIDGNCATCYDKYILSVTNECLMCSFTGCKADNQTVTANVCTCTQCLSGYDLAGATDGNCSACALLNCATCPGDVNTCTGCATDYYLNAAGPSCDPIVVTGCETTASSSTCSVCLPRYFKGADSLCYSCQSNCLTCSDRWSCTLCDSGFHLQGSYCVKIPANCVEINTSNLKCSLCSHGFYLYNEYCVECSVEKGTLSKCEGLCPIDYYIQSLLVTTSGAPLAALTSVLMLIMLAV